MLSCTISDPELYISLYCAEVFACMVYRISISEGTMERMRELAKSRHVLADGLGYAGNRKYGLTVEDIICELLREAGF